MRSCHSPYLRRSCLTVTLSQRCIRGTLLDLASRPGTPCREGSSTYLPSVPGERCGSWAPRQAIKNHVSARLLYILTRDRYWRRFRDTKKKMGILFLKAIYERRNPHMAALNLPDQNSSHQRQPGKTPCRPESDKIFLSVPISSKWHLS